MFLTFSIQSLWPLAILLTLALITGLIVSLPGVKIIPSMVLELIIGGVAIFIFGNNPQFKTFFFAEGGHVLNDASELVYMLGLSCLLLLSGLDADFSKGKRLRKGDKRFLIYPFIILLLILTFGLSYLATLLFNKYIIDMGTLKATYGRFLLMICFASTFASMVVPVVHDSELGHTSIGKIISAYATIAELLSIVGLSVIMVLISIADGKKISVIASIIIILIILAFIFIKLFLPEEKIFKSKFHGVTEIGSRFTILVILVLVLLSDLIGVEYILGAFLAGLILKLSSKEKEFSVIERIGYGFFVPLFYILLGMKLGIKIRGLEESFWTIDNLWLFLKVILAIVVTKIPMLILYFFYPGKTVIPSMFLTTTTIIVAVTLEHLSEHSHIFNENLTTMLILVSILTCIFPPIFFGNGKDFGTPRPKFNNLLFGKHLEECEEITNDYSSYENEEIISEASESNDFSNEEINEDIESIEESVDNEEINEQEEKELPRIGNIDYNLPDDI